MRMVMCYAPLMLHLRVAELLVVEVAPKACGKVC
jgi:hypothetical protein